VQPFFFFLFSLCCKSQSCFKWLLLTLWVCYWIVFLVLFFLCWKSVKTLQGEKTTERDGEDREHRQLFFSFIFSTFFLFSSSSSSSSTSSSFSSSFFTRLLWFVRVCARSFVRDQRHLLFISIKLNTRKKQQQQNESLKEKRLLISYNQGLTLIASSDLIHQQREAATVWVTLTDPTGSRIPFSLFPSHKKWDGFMRFSPSSITVSAMGFSSIPRAMVTLHFNEALSLSLFSVGTAAHFSKEKMCVPFSPVLFGTNSFTGSCRFVLFCSVVWSGWQLRMEEAKVVP